MKRIIICIVMMFTMMLASNAQNVVKEGNTFTQVSASSSTGKETKTEYTYKTKDGKTYDIYLSAKGKAFIKRISSKTGKEYKQYIPEIGRQINPDAYKEK